MNPPAFPPRNKKVKALAKGLRKNLTKQERHLWYDFLKSLPVQFYRQYTIESYIVDFYCPKALLAIELDGSQHYEPQAIQNDINRTKTISQYGIKVIRYTNRDINERFNEVCEDIYNELNIRLGK